MPVSSVGFLLRPDGFFDANPALDLAPASRMIQPVAAHRSCECRTAPSSTSRFLCHRLFLVRRRLPGRADNTAPEGFVSLFNGKDLTGWKIPEGDGGHWKVVDGVIDYDAESEAKGDKALWSDRRVSATSSCRSIGGSRRRRSSTRTSLTSCPMAPTPRTSTARN